MTLNVGGLAFKLQLVCGSRSVNLAPFAGLLLLQVSEFSQRGNLERVQAVPLLCDRGGSLMVFAEELFESSLDVSSGLSAQNPLPAHFNDFGESHLAFA